ncbi:MAG: DUF2147 domain-containing protein [Hyphomicrobiales bacterium]|nr:DUF2147 domain-containing protein [Hyphomicrobiales bacterium]
MVRRVKISCAIALWIGFLTTSVLAADELKSEDVFGSWRLPENNSIVDIYECSGRVCVKVVSVADPGRRDVRNPDPALRDRLLIGIVIADKFQRARDPSDLSERKFQWRGQLYSTLDGATYDGSLNLLDKDTITMVGCVLSGLFCEAKTFKRIKNEAPTAVSGQTSGSAGSTVSIASPPMPTRKPAQTQTVALREIFNRFLDTDTQRTSRRYSPSEREKLFEDFQAWLDLQPEEKRKRITQQLSQ